VQAALGVIKVAAIVALVAGGFLAAARPGSHAASPAAPLAADTLKAFGAALIPVVFSYGGWQTTNYVAGEIKNPARNLAPALILGVAAVIVLYLAVNAACLAALGPQRLAATLTPASDVLSLLVGPAGGRIAAAAVALSALAFLSQCALTGPRVFFAMARDGLFFRRVGEVARGSRAPAVAILVLCAWASVLALSGSYEEILSFVIAMNLLFFALATMSLFVFRAREQRAGAAERHAGCRTPGHPFTTAAFAGFCLFVVVASFWSYPVNSLIGYGILALGLPPYLFWRRRLAPAPAALP
jgi:basic amino acid/polyamine antiporter, APA family